jgi:hypothetical protein
VVCPYFLFFYASKRAKKIKIGELFCEIDLKLVKIYDKTMVFLTESQYLLGDCILKNLPNSMLFNILNKNVILQVSTFLYSRGNKKMSVLSLIVPSSIPFFVPFFDYYSILPIFEFKKKSPYYQELAKGGNPLHYVVENIFILRICLTLIFSYF